MLPHTHKKATYKCKKRYYTLIDIHKCILYNDVLDIIHTTSIDRF